MNSQWNKVRLRRLDAPYANYSSTQIIRRHLARGRGRRRLERVQTRGHLPPLPSKPDGLSQWLPDVCRPLTMHRKCSGVVAMHRTSQIVSRKRCVREDLTHYQKLPKAPTKSCKHLP